jgi:hypothetical protein
MKSIHLAADSFQRNSSAIAIENSCIRQQHRGACRIDNLIGVALIGLWYRHTVSISKILFVENNLGNLRQQPSARTTTQTLKLGSIPYPLVPLRQRLWTQNTSNLPQNPIPPLPKRSHHSFVNGILPEDSVTPEQPLHDFAPLSYG